MITKRRRHKCVKPKSVRHIYLETLPQVLHNIEQVLTELDRFCVGLGIALFLTNSIVSIYTIE